MPELRICAVIVTYNYATDLLSRLVELIKEQVDHVCILDNNPRKTGEAGLSEACSKDCTVITNRDNLGLAKAINQGIQFALENHYNHVLVLDQDSRPAPDMVNKLAAALKILDEKGRKIAAVGPVVIDRHRKKPLPFRRFKKTHIKKIIPLPHDSSPFWVDYLISSGSLLTMKALSTVGLMDEGLFIDNVDLEWCFRVKKSRYELYGVPTAFLSHQLGDETKKAPILKEHVALHCPERQYFIMRNRLILYGRYYVPFHWKLNDIPRLICRFVFFSLFVPPQHRNAVMMLKGIKDGFYDLLNAFSSVTKSQLSL